LKNIWAPWRIGYLKSAPEEKCVFCITTDEEKDEENLILYRGKKCFVIVNKYPYSNGHLMSVPYRHVADFAALDNDELLELQELLQLCMKVLNETLHPHGFNIGLNMGKAAGAGIDQHLHYHIVPRWNGDTNFMPVVGSTKVISQALADNYRELRVLFQKYGAANG
jgi:ATP adenylyltransferase